MVEFSTKPINGMIKIPDEYADFSQSDVKVILIKPDTPSGSHSKGNALKKLFLQAQDKDIFQDIDDPVQWQKQIRDEW